MSWYRNNETTTQLFIKVVPGAHTTQVMGLLGNRLKIRIAAPPEKGKANKELVSFLARQLDVAKQHIAITFGDTIPEKNILITESVNTAVLERLAFTE